MAISAGEQRHFPANLALPENPCRDLAGIFCSSAREKSDLTLLGNIRR
jgi:hypothetical protein